MWSLENVIGAKTQDYDLKKSKLELERSLHETFHMLMIEELEIEKKEKAIQVFNRSIQYLGSKRKECNLNVLRSYLEELKLLLRTMKWQVREIERNGQNVRGFHGVGKLQRSSHYVEKWICVFLLQFKEKNRITWNFEKVDKFTKEMEVFCKTIDQVEFVTLNYNRVLEQFIGRQETTRL